VKKVLVVLLTLAFIIGISATALAIDIANNQPSTYIEYEPDDSDVTTITTAGTFGYGASRWVYKDKNDANFKYEGSYRIFQEQTATGSTDQGGYGAGFYNFDGATPTPSNYGYQGEGQRSGPHDGYDTVSNKCKTCHSVHRATGSYRMMRVDDPGDACSYCHIGDHKHSLRGAYYRSDVSGVYTKNGHTMGAGQTIPDSTVKMWLTTKTYTIVDSNGTTQTITYKMREYEVARNKMFYWTNYRSTFHANGWLRIGPTYLSCLSCHQPHNANQLIWKPAGVYFNGSDEVTVTFSDGYKLLRLSPSGSTANIDRMVGYVALTIEDSITADQIIRVPEGKIIQNVTGNNGDSSITEYPLSADGNRIVWTTWKGPSFYALDATRTASGKPAVPKLSIWCADCHNLNIGYFETLSGEVAIGMRSGNLHSDRTHTSSGDLMECWNCHSSNMPINDDDALAYGLDVVGCNQCHYYGDGTTYYRDARWLNPKTDFPHSGSQTGFKLLTEMTNNTATDTAIGNINFGVTSGADGNDLDPSLDGFCLRCHDMIGIGM